MARLSESEEMQSSLFPLMACFIAICLCHRSKRPALKFQSPAPAARVWVDEDRPAEVSFEATGVDLPEAGYIILYINGREIAQKFERNQNAISFPELDEGVYNLEIKLFDRSGKYSEVSASTAFAARRYLELMVHEDYPVSAEGPRADGSLARMPGLQEWDYVTSPDAVGSATARLHALWTQKLAIAANGSAADAADAAAADAAADRVFSAYREFHRSIMADPTLWASNQFLVYRTMDRGLGNQLESLVSAFAMALLTNRVFLVDSTLVHHLFRRAPARGGSKE